MLLTCACIQLHAQVYIITTICGNDTGTYNGDNIPATNAHVNAPEGLCLDHLGNLYIADGFNQRIRKINFGTGIITTVAGNGSAGFSGDDGPATDAQLSVPESVFADTANNIYIADALNNRIRKINVTNGIITTVAGSGATGTGGGGDSGDGGAATNAQLRQPVSLCFDRKNNLYIADYANNKIRKVDAVTNIITTIAGNGASGYSGDNNTATNATFSGTIEVYVDKNDNVLICDQYNHAVRKINASTGIITTIAGTGAPGYSGNNGPASNAQLNEPSGLFVDDSENIFIAENGAIKRIDAATGIITTVAGNDTMTLVRPQKCKYSLQETITGKDDIYITVNSENPKNAFRRTV